MNAIEKIRAEIERRQTDNLNAEQQTKTGIFGAAAKEDFDLLSFIDQLPTKENPILVPADVQEAAEKYGREKFLECQEYGSCGKSELAEAYTAGMLAERERLASFPTFKGWVARDANGILALYDYEKKPTRREKTWRGSVNIFLLDEELLPDLRWEDEPREVEIIIKEVGK